MEIKVNGQTYSRWEDVPPDVQALLARTLPDADHDGVPDLFEGDLTGLPTDGTRTVTHTTVTVGGKVVGPGDRMSPLMQSLVRRMVDLPDGAAVAATAADPTTVHPTPGPSAAAPPAPAADQVVLNGVAMSVDGAAGASERKGFWRRLLGR